MPRADSVDKFSFRRKKIDCRLLKNLADLLVNEFGGRLSSSSAFSVTRPNGNACSCPNLRDFLDKLNRSKSYTAKHYSFRFVVKKKGKNGFSLSITIFTDEGGTKVHIFSSKPAFAAKAVDIVRSEFQLRERTWFRDLFSVQNLKTVVQFLGTHPGRLVIIMAVGGVLIWSRQITFQKLIDLVLGAV